MLTEVIVSVLAAFAPNFTKSTWKNLQTLFTGAIRIGNGDKKSHVARDFGISRETLY